MASNAQKTPFGQSLNDFAEKVADKANQLLGKSFPASVTEIMGAIFKTKFEITGPKTIPSVTIPSVGSRYFRAPIQAGEKGMTIGADAYLGGMSGLGGGTADLTPPANLTALAWVPLGSKDWPSVDPDTNVITGGPNGFLVRNSESPVATITGTSSSITISVGATSLTINASGVFITSNLSVTGTLMNNSVNVGSTHVHSGVQTGGGNTNVPH